MQIWDLLNSHKKGELSYQDSVSLFFDLYPEKKRSLASLLEFENEMSRERINEGLETKFNELQVNQKTNELKQFVPSIHEQNKINLEILPAELRERHGKLSPIISKISMLNARLDLFKSDEDRYLAAKEAVELWQERQSIFDEIDDFMEPGKKKEPEPITELKPDITKNYKNEHELRLLRSQRTKLKEKTHRKADYDRVCARIAEIEKERY
jgi:hypothetical protein